MRRRTWPAGLLAISLGLAVWGSVTLQRVVAANGTSTRVAHTVRSSGHRAAAVGPGLGEPVHDDRPVARGTGRPGREGAAEPASSGDDAALPRIEVPSIGVRAPVVPVGVSPGGRLRVPADDTRVGWWSGGAAAGKPGPAVFVGHVDSRTGPAVFSDLARVKAGAAIEVYDAGGEAHRFRVTRIERRRKRTFPSVRVYGSTPGPTIRLITCGGPWDAERGHYRDNVIVFGRAAGSGRT